MFTSITYFTTKLASDTASSFLYWISASFPGCQMCVHSPGYGYLLDDWSPPNSSHRAYTSHPLSSAGGDGSKVNSQTLCRGKISPGWIVIGLVLCSVQGNGRERILSQLIYYILLPLWSASSCKEVHRSLLDVCAMGQIAMINMTQFPVLVAVSCISSNFLY